MTDTQMTAELRRIADILRVDRRSTEAHASFAMLVSRASRSQKTALLQTLTAMIADCKVTR